MNIQSGFMRCSLALSVVVAAALTACGGGGGGSGVAAVAPTPTTPSVQAAAAGTTSTGVITAFGSVFVGGHEFDTSRASVIDDDTGTSTSGATGLEVGMVLDVKPTSDSSASKPIASELHIHPLVRGYVDATDTTAGTIKVMGQTVQLTSSTNISDHRACVSATTAPCTAISTPADLSATTAPTAPGSYVSVHGYLYGNSSGASIVATLVSVADAPTGSSRANFKAEGVVNIGTTKTVSIGALTLDLSSATCRVAGKTVPCIDAFSTGQVVSAGSAVAPTLPVSSLSASFARLASKTAVDNAGDAVEMEGVVSSVGTGSFVVRGVTVDTSGLPAGSTVPGAGDVVRVLGTLGSNGQSVSATSVVVLHAASSTKLGLEGDASAVTTVTAGSSYTLQVLGQTIAVNVRTRLKDMSVRDWDRRDPAANPFNISTFADYMLASKSSHVIAKTETDANGNLVANSISIMPASGVAAVAGLVDATPAVVNSAVAGTPSKLSVHGIAIEVEPAAVQVRDRSGKGGAFNTISAGDQVVALGSWNGTKLSIGATVTMRNQLLDAGAPRAEDHDRGEF